MAAASYLDTLNIQQRQAVEHGVLRDDCTPRSPLLVIAGVWLALGRPTPPLRAAMGSPPHDRSLAGAPGD